MKTGPRFEAREYQSGKFTVYGVYDTQTDRWPAIMAGRSIAHTTEDRAEAERDAAWLNEQYR